MAKVPDKITDYAQRHPDYVQPADYRQDVIPALIEGVADVAQTQLEAPVAALLSINNLDSGAGPLLDYWGGIVGVPRNGRADDIYRVAIRAAIAINTSNATWPDLLAIAESAYGGYGAVDDSPVEYYDSQPAEAVIEVKRNTVTSGVSPAAVFASLDRARAAGVRLQYIAWAADDDDIFALSDTASLASGDTARGLADTAQTSGGRMTNALASTNQTDR